MCRHLPFLLEGIFMVKGWGVPILLFVTVLTLRPHIAGDAYPFAQGLLLIPILVGYAVLLLSPIKTSGISQKRPPCSADSVGPGQLGSRFSFLGARPGAGPEGEHHPSRKHYRFFCGVPGHVQGKGVQEKLGPCSWTYPDSRSGKWSPSKDLRSGAYPANTP